MNKNRNAAATMDLFSFIKWPVIVGMGWFGVLNWWVILALVLLEIKIDIKIN